MVVVVVVLVVGQLWGGEGGGSMAPKSDMYETYCYKIDLRDKYIYKHR